MQSKIVILSMLLMATTLNEAQASAAVSPNANNAGTQTTPTTVIYDTTNNTGAKPKTTSYKSKFFIGGAAQLSSFKAKFNQTHTAHNSSNRHNGNKFNFDDELQGSINAGFNYYFPVGANNAIFISPEIVYNFVSLESNKTVSLNNGNTTNFKLTLEPTWEAKLALGMEFKQKFSIAAGGGIQAVKYDYNYQSPTASNHNRHNSHNKDEIAIGGSLALGYNLSKNLTLKTSVSYYNFDFKLNTQDIVIPGSNIPQDKIKAEMLTTKLGLEYAF